MEHLLKIEGLTKHYPEFSLQDVSFSVPGGSIMGFVGENGAGKTTTIKLILDEFPRDGGSVTVFGRDNREAGREIREDIGVVFDDAHFHEIFTAQEVGAFLKDCYRKWDAACYDALLKRLELPAKKRIKEFSRGMRMKLSIAAAMAHRPRLLLLDEPTSGLDPIVRDEVLELFQEFIGDEEHAVLFSSHITEDLEKIADYVAYLHRGRLQFVRSKDELLYEYGIVKCGKSEFERMDASDFAAWRENAYEIQALTENREAARRKYPNCVIDRAGLEDIMLLYSKGNVRR